jgi:hypothetical protein
MLAARPEDQILICVARPALDEATNQQLRQLFEGDLDWQYLLATADQHCVVPLLYRHVMEMSAGAAPAQALKKLEDANHENTNSNLFLTGELVKLLDFLQANGVQAIPFKGPTLALAAYGDIGLRQFADLDILIHKTDLGKMSELLGGQGFKPHLELSDSQAAALGRFDCAWNFINAKNVMVDVHWDLVERHLAFAVDSSGLWERLETVNMAGKQLFTLASEDLLLVLCLHGFTHFWERLGWISDVAGIIERQKQVDWQLLMQNAERLGCRRILSLGLLLASDLLQARLPPEVLKIVNRDPVVSTVAEQVKEQLFIKRVEPAGILGEARRLLSLRERKRDKLRSFFRLLLMPRTGDWMFLPLPGPLFFLYYLVRPLRLAGKYGTTLVATSSDQRSASVKSLQL